MRKNSGAGLAIAMAFLTLSHASAGDPAAARFDKFKALKGDWVKSGGDGSVAVTYRLTAAGTAVVETLFPGSPEEMVTVYTLDKGELVLTHYCAQGNQPHMKAVHGPDANTVAFKFDGGGNIKSAKDDHMHGATFTFKDADHFTSSWQFYKGGKPAEKAEFSLVRKES